MIKWIKNFTWRTRTRISKANKHVKKNLDLKINNSPLDRSIDSNSNLIKLIYSIIILQIIFNITLRDNDYWLSILVIAAFLSIYPLFGRQEFQKWFPIYFVFVIYDILDYVLEIIPFDNTINRFRMDHKLFSFNFDDYMFSSLFSGKIPSHYLLEEHIVLLDILFGVIYLWTVIMLVIFTLYIRIKEPYYFKYISISAVLTAFITSLLFIFFPTPPPWFTYYYGVNVPLDISVDKNYAAGGLWNLEKAIPFFPITDILWHFSIFKFGSFPSIHIIISTQVFIFLRRMENKYQYWALGLLLINCLGVIYLAHHYVIDVFVGFILGITMVRLSFKLRLEFLNFI